MMGMCIANMTQLRSSHLLRYNHRVSTTVGVQDLSQVYVSLGYSWVELNVMRHSDRDRTKSHCSDGFCFFEKSPGEELRHPRWDLTQKKENWRRWNVQLVRPQASDGVSHNGPAQQLHGMPFTWTSALMSCSMQPTQPNTVTWAWLDTQASPQSLLLSCLCP